MQTSELQKVTSQSQRDSLVIYNKIPYSLINAELGTDANNHIAELTNIMKYYKVYKQGVDFLTEGANGDYLPAQLHYKLATSLINKQARFLFAEPPSITIDPKGAVGTISQSTKDSLTTLNELVKTVLDYNKFEEQLIKAAKDCFIGKRVAGLVNFNQEDGITVTFLPAQQFIYTTKMGNPNIIEKFVAFIVVKESANQTEKRIFKKKYVLENNNVYLQEELYSGNGTLIATVTPLQKVLLKAIPVSIFINDGLTGEQEGESDVANVQGFEELYNKLANADTDAGRKSMNPIRYTIDMDSRSTQNLSSGAGAHWDLGTDQQLDKPSPQVGVLENNMNYSDALKVTLDRIKLTAYEQLDIPNVNLETMQGAITSGKSLKAVYWPLIVRCKEKMKMWKPQLQLLISHVIEGSYLYPLIAQMYVNEVLSPIEYDVEIEQNHPLPEDEMEEKNMDILEVESKTMSRKSYMKKWRNLTDEETIDELNQIALERQIIDDSTFTSAVEGVPLPETTF